MKDTGALKKYEPRNHRGSLEDVKNDVHFKMSVGFRVDKDYVEKLNTN